MKRLTLITLTLFIALSCRKKDISKDTPVPRYPKPWNTKDISYQNIYNMCGTHTNGYKLYYQDTMLRTECADMGYMQLEHDLLIDRSTLLLFKHGKYSSSVLSTHDGGFSWKETRLFGEFFSKFHRVDQNLVYCITDAVVRFYVTGIEQSELPSQEIPRNKGRYRVFDPGAGNAGQDSTVVSINDSVTVAIIFK